MVLPREKSCGWPLVFIRCVPHRIAGITGTPAAAAIRVAPVLNSLSSKLREMVASGKMPTTSPSRSSRTPSSYDASPSARSTETWCSDRISGPVHRWSNSSRLAMNRTSRFEGCVAKPPSTKST